MMPTRWIRQNSKAVQKISNDCDSRGSFTVSKFRRGRSIEYHRKKMKKFHYD